MASKGPAFFGALSAALGGSGGGGVMDIMRGITGGKSGESSGGKPPVDNSHSHGSSGNTSAMAAGVGASPSSNVQTYSPRSDGSGTQDPTFMGAKQLDTFQEISPDSSSIDDRGKDVSRLDIEAPVNPPMGVPVENDLDKEGTMNSLYSPAKVVLPKKSGTYSDTTYGIKATSGVKNIKNKK